MKQIAVGMVLFCAALCSRAQAQGGIVTTVAGNGPSCDMVRACGAYSGDGGPATAASLNLPDGVAVDASGNLFIADSWNNRIRKVSPGGIITTVAGTGPVCTFAACGGFSGDGGLATAASLNTPTSVAVDASGNLFIADYGNNRIRKVSPNGIVTTVAGDGIQRFSGDGGPAASASLYDPVRIAVDASGNLFIADTGNERIRKVSPGGTITTVAGNGTQGFSGDFGPATSASLYAPEGIAVDGSGDLFIADYGNSRIRKVSPGGVISTVAGNGTQALSGDGGPAASASLQNASSLAVDASGNLFILDDVDVREVWASGTITTIAGDGDAGFSGDGGAAITASFNNPFGIAMDASGNLFIADTSNNRIREIPAPVSVMPPAFTPPSIGPNGIVPVFSTMTTIQPGEWASVYGSNLANSTVSWDGTFPLSLGGTSVTVDGKVAYLSYVSPGQLNFQVPDDRVPGDPTVSESVPVVVTTAAASATATVNLGIAAPSFSLLDSKHVAGIILRSDGSGAYGGGAWDIVGPTGISLGYPTVAAKAGDSVELYGVGFGPTTPAVPAGQPFSGAAPAVNPVQVTIDGVTVTPSFAGLSAAGTVQINLTIPAGAGTGDVPIVASVLGVQTPLTDVISLRY